LDVSDSCFSKQLKNVLKIPGCESDCYRINCRFRYYQDYKHKKLKFYNLNTVVAIAYRVNNARCREFLEYYHRVMLGLRVRLVGMNYYIPSIIEGHEFVAFARLFSPPLEYEEDEYDDIL